MSARVSEVRRIRPFRKSQGGYIGATGAKRVIRGQNARARLQALLDSSGFYAELTHDLRLTRGTGSPTMVRATTGYVENNDGYQVQAIAGEARFTGARRVRNLIAGSSEVIANANWTLGGSASRTASTITFTAAAGDYVQQLLTPSEGVVSRTYVFKVLLSVASGAKAIRLGVVQQLIGTTYQAITVTTTPTWYSVTRINTSAASTQISPIIQNDAAGTSGTVIFGGAQLEDVTAQTTQTAGEYVSVGVLSAPYHGAGVDGVKYFDTDISGNPISASVLKGYLAEGARTNSLLYARDLTNAAWVKTDCTAALDAVGLDGATAASTLTATGANATCLQTLTLAAAARSYGVYIKRKTGTGAVSICRDGSTFTDITAQINSSTYTRVKIENTSVLNPVCGIKLATSGDEVYVDYNQDEAGTFVSKPILTTTVAATRNSDIDAYPTASNIVAAAGSIYLEYTPYHAPSGTIALWGTYVDANNYTAILHDGVNLIFRKRIASTNNDASVAHPLLAGETYKIMATYGSAGMTLQIDDLASLGNSNTTAAQIGTTMQWGADGNGLQQPFGTIGECHVW